VLLSDSLLLYYTLFTLTSLSLYSFSLCQVMTRGNPSILVEGDPNTGRRKRRRGNEPVEALEY